MGPALPRRRLGGDDILRRRRSGHLREDPDHPATPHHSTATVPPLDVFVHPGGDGTRGMLNDPDHLQWLREQRQHVPVMTSVCTGSTVFAATGLLHNRPATTNRTGLDQLTRLDDTIIVKPGHQYVDAGDIITAAGISAGIDMALHIVGRLTSPERARQVRDGIEYHPEPPH